MVRKPQKPAANSQTTRSAPLGLRITPELKDALLAEAASQKRSLANYIEWELERLMREKGRME